MALQTYRSDRWEKWFDACAETRAAVLSVLRHRYVRESQHAMRYRQHAEKIHDLESPEALSASLRKRRNTLNRLARK